MTRLTYRQLAEIISRLPAEMQDTNVTVVDHTETEAYPVEGFFEVGSDQENKVSFMDGILDVGHPVLSIRLSEVE